MNPRCLFQTAIGLWLVAALATACSGPRARHTQPPLPPAPTPIAGRPGGGLPAQTAVAPTATLRPEDTPTATPLPPPQIVAVPPAGKLYHGVFTAGRSGMEDDMTPADLRRYEQAAGKPAAWVYFSDNWDPDRRFPLQTMTWIRQAGSVPYVRLMLRTKYLRDEAEPFFTLDRILAGDFDADLRAWAAAAAEFRTPIIAEYGTEVNLRAWPWNGTWNGGGETGQYGDPGLPDGPEKYRAAYRHIIQIFRDEGATNVLWVFHANQRSVPGDDWNRLEQYYPGDAWIDWIGVSLYGAQSPVDTDWEEFSPMMDAVYPRLAAMAPGKPVIVAEFGVAAGNPLGFQPTWAKAALADLTGGRWPNVIGFAWWNEAWNYDQNPAKNTSLRLEDNPALAAVFQLLVGQNDAVLGRAIFTPAPTPTPR